MFMDKGFNAIFRSAHSELSEQTQILEREANTFAAYILMPDHLLKETIDKIDFDLGSEDEIKNLAKVFDVSSQAMYYRILNSGLLNFNYDYYYVSVEDGSDRGDGQASKEQKNVLTIGLQKTNWRLISTEIISRMGYLSGQLKGFDQPEHLEKLIKEIEQE